MHAAAGSRARVVDLAAHTPTESAVERAAAPALKQAHVYTAVSLCGVAPEQLGTAAQLVGGPDLDVVDVTLAHVLGRVDTTRAAASAVEICRRHLRESKAVSTASNVAGPVLNGASRSKMAAAPA